MTTSPRIPLTVLGGYLGAGKTTLLNRILLGDHGRRLAVIVNDFGDVNIDERLLEVVGGGLRALANGCVCCQAVDGLAAALTDIAALDPRPEHVFIEASGVSDPWKVAQWGRSPGYELDGVIALADPTALPTLVTDHYIGDTVIQQLRSADLVVLSRVDVVDSVSIERALAVIADATPAPTLLGSDVVLELLLAPHRLGVAGQDHHAPHSAVSFVPASVSRSDLEAWLHDAPAAVMRVKGFVDSETDGPLLAQRMGRRVEVTRRPDPEPPQMLVIAAEPSTSAPVAAWVASLS